MIPHTKSTKRKIGKRKTFKRKLGKRKTIKRKIGKRNITKRKLGKRKTFKRKLRGGIGIDENVNIPDRNPNNIKAGDLVELNEVPFDQKIKDKYKFSDKEWKKMKYYNQVEKAKTTGWNNKYFIVTDIDNYTATVLYATPDMIADYDHIKTLIKNRTQSSDFDLYNINNIIMKSQHMELMLPLFKLKHAAKKYNIEYYSDWWENNKEKYEDNSTIESKNVWYCYAHGADVAEELDGQNEDIVLRDDQIIIMNCRPLSLTFDAFYHYSKLNDWTESVYNIMGKIIQADEYKHPSYKHKQKRCVFRNKVPNISLRFIDNENVTGLFKLPVKFEENNMVHNLITNLYHNTRNRNIYPDTWVTFKHAFKYIPKPIPLLSEVHYSNYKIKKSKGQALPKIQEGGNINCSPNCQMTLKEMLHNTRTRSGALLINTPFTLFITACRVDHKKDILISESDLKKELYDDGTTNLNIIKETRRKFGDPTLVNHDDFNVLSENNYSKITNESSNSDDKQLSKKYSARRPIPLDPKMVSPSVPFANPDADTIPIANPDADTIPIANPAADTIPIANPAQTITDIGGDWVKIENIGQYPYYVNKITNISQWDHPFLSQTATVG